MKYPKVIFLGGAPMLGKTSVGRILACRLNYSSISTDDIGIAIGAVTKTSQPIDMDYREFYLRNTLDELIRDINDQHERLWPALRILIQKHASWGHPAVIEGWALRPTHVQSLSGDISGLFLLADEALIEKRVRSSDFSMGASNVELMIERYCQRSNWYNKFLRAETMRLGLKALEISDGMPPEEIAEKCLELLCLDKP